MEISPAKNKKNKTKKLWKNSEVKLVMAGEIPEGRTYHAVQQFCCRNGLRFPGKRWLSKQDT